MTGTSCLSRLLRLKNFHVFSKFSQIVTFSPVTNIPQYFHYFLNNSVLRITCLIKHASHLAENVFTRESLSGGTLLNTSFTKKGKQKKQKKKINKKLKNHNKTLNMNITTFRSFCGFAKYSFEKT